MISHETPLSTSAEITALAEKLKGKDIIAFDTEFIRESTFYPIVEIIQVATDEESWLVDAAAFKKGFKPGPQGGFDPGLKPLLEIFENKSILKILHAAQGDQECLFTSFGVVAQPSIDTAVAASLCGYGEGIGLGKLLKSVLGVEIAKGHARTNWSVRPLPRQLVDYAHADVEHLVELGRKLIAQLDQLGRKAWALEASARWENRALYDLDIEGLAHKLGRGGKLDKKSYSALHHLIRWREERVRHLNLPRRWVADDAVLIDLARVRPKDMEHLAAFRGLNKGELKNSGEAILSALRKGTEDVGKAPPKSERAAIPSTAEAQAIDLVRCYVGILADKHRISARHLMPAAELLNLLRKPAASRQELVEAGVLGEAAAELIGDELIAFLHGKRGLSINGSQIQITELPERGTQE